MCQCYSHCQGQTDPMQLGSNVETIDAKHTPRGSKWYTFSSNWGLEKRAQFSPRVQNGLRESEIEIGLGFYSDQGGVKVKVFAHLVSFVVSISHGENHPVSLSLVQREGEGREEGEPYKLSVAV